MIRMKEISHNLFFQMYINSKRGVFMHINSLMIPFEALQIVRTNEEIGDALAHIKSGGFLSLPVVDEQDCFVGVLSRRYIYEEYFNNDEVDKDAFNKRKVHEFMKSKLPVTKDNIYIEEAALLLFESKLTFLPVVDEHTNRLKGIITSGKLLAEYKNIFGIGYPKLVIYIYDFKGKMAQIANIISKTGGSIKNIVQTDTEVMGFQEITLRVEAKDIHKVVKHLQKEGIEVREFTE